MSCACFGPRNSGFFNLLYILPSITGFGSGDMTQILKPLEAGGTAIGHWKTLKRGGGGHHPKFILIEAIMAMRMTCKKSL